MDTIIEKVLLSDWIVDKSVEAFYSLMIDVGGSSPTISGTTPGQEVLDCIKGEVSDPGSRVPLLLQFLPPSSCLELCLWFLSVMDCSL